MGDLSVSANPVGECGTNGGEFGMSYASCGAVSNVLPADAVIRGCPPAPLDLMRGILETIGKGPKKK